jgi:hypothetical protein
LLAAVRLNATYQARLRKIAAALAVALVHLAAIRGLLAVRALFERASAPQTAIATWIILPPEPASAKRPDSAPPRIAAGLPMEPLSGKDAAAMIPTLRITTLTPLIPPLVVLPPLATEPNNDALVFSALAADLSCTFANYDSLSDAERARCALRLSGLGDVAALPDAFIDSKVTPFSLFGAHGTFAFTPPAERSFDLLQASMGCEWEQGLCRPPEPEKFGFDPEDTKRGSAVAHFELAKGWALDAGAQGYMQNYLGGARLIYTAGVSLTYRW